MSHNQYHEPKPFDSEMRFCFPHSDQTRTLCIYKKFVLQDQTLKYTLHLIFPKNLSMLLQYFPSPWSGNDKIP